MMKEIWIVHHIFPPYLDSCYYLAVFGMYEAALISKTKTYNGVVSPNAKKEWVERGLWETHIRCIRSSLNNLDVFC